MHILSLLRSPWLLVLLIVLGLHSTSRAEVVVIPVEGEVSNAQMFFVRRSVKDAEAGGATGIMLQINTYGGALGAAIEMLDVFRKTSLPVKAFIDGNAGSAGALIALGTKEIYMSPVSAIGAAAPVMGGGQDLEETMKEKTVSYFSKYFRSAAEQNGHNPDIAEAFIDQRKEVKIGEKVISEKGQLLTLSAQEATTVYNGKPLLAIAIAENVEDAIAKAGWPAEYRVAKKTGFEGIAIWLTRFSPLLLMIAVAAGWLEFKTPGFGIPGFVSILFFLLFFLGSFGAGLAGMELLALFFVGVLLVAIEIFLFPGTVLLGLSGVALILGSLIWAMLDRYPNMPLLPTADMMLLPVANLLIAFIGAGICAFLLAKYLPQIPFVNRLVLATANAAGGSLAGAGPSSGVATSPGLVGLVGVAATLLRPSGKGRFGDRLLDVTSNDQYIPEGTAIRIIEARGSRIVVEVVESAEGAV